MGKSKKGFNWKAREIVEVKTDDSFKKTVQVDFNTNQSYDEANPLVLPSKKRKTSVKRDRPNAHRILSNKQRKHLEKIVDRKKRKQDRASLLQSLLEVQGTPELLTKLTSISEIQTKGIKRIYEDCDEIPSEIKISDTKKLKLHSLKGRRKFKREESKTKDPNVVGFSSSESEGEDDDNSDNDSDRNDSKKEDISESNQPPRSPNKSDVVDETNDEVEIIDVHDRTTNPEEIDIGSDSEHETISTAKPNNVPKANDSELNSNSKSAEKTFKKPISNIPNISPKPKTFVSVDRLPEIQRVRLKLPIIGEEQVIMEAINDNDVVVIAGETGSGKTTQLPQFLYEAGYSLNGRIIGVTEPRRVAAISMSRRVAEELNLSSDIVSYLIRFEGNAGPNTQIKFMTDGVLLKEIQHDFMLSKYSVIILDEAHERSVYTDILIGLLSRIVPFRRKKGNPLKLIIMSATLRLSEFTENSKLFKVPPPVIKVDARQYPVTVHFNKRTAVDYMREAYRKACKIHTQLPDGGILIFLTGQQEVNTLVKKLRQTFPYSPKKNSSNQEKNDSENKGENHEIKEINHECEDTAEIKKDENNQNEVENENAEDSDDEIDRKSLKQKLKKIQKNSLPEINLEDYATKPSEDGMEDDDDLDDDFANEPIISGKSFQPMWVLPLYSYLDSKKQAKVFEPPPEGSRLCVVATNVAETSLTIPSIKYVVDSGRTKVRLYDKVTGVTTFAVSWTSKASADQRAGRAGRTAPGHCYRLYSSAVYNDEFEEWSVPEIQRKPVDDLLLQMKSLKIERVVNFPFPSPPDTTQLKTAERRLTLLGALKAPIRMKDEWSSKLTPLGESMAAFPVSPRYAKMLCLSQQFDLLPYTIAIVAALSVQEFLLKPNDNFGKIWRTWAKAGNKLLLGDVMVLLTALGSAEHASTKGNMEKFCNEHGLRYKAVLEARKLRVQLTNELNANLPDLNLCVDPQMKPPTDEQARQLRQIIMSGMVDQVAYKLTADELKEAGLSAQKAAYRIADLEDIILLNSSSVLRKIKPEWIVYQEVYQINDKLYARGITAIEPEWLPLYAAPLCNISEPLKEPPPYYDESSGRVMCCVSSSFGRSGWQLPIVEVEYPEGEERYKWFAQFFLQGLVCPQLQEYVADLLSPPDTVFKIWAKFLIGRSTKFLNALMGKRVYSKETLLCCWKNDSSYLLEQYLEWLPESAHHQVKEIWPPK